MNFCAFTIIHSKKEQKKNVADEFKSRLHITDEKKSRFVGDVAENGKVNCNETLNFPLHLIKKFMSRTWS